MNANVLEKLKILAESAKYDVSCASSGTVRANKPGTLGNTVGGWGICHSFAEDGRCISLLKVMLTNYCIYDCAYCINRRSMKMLAVPVQKLTPRYNKIQTIDDVPEDYLAQIRHFFEHYKDLEKGKWAKVSGWTGPEEACKVIMKGVEAYNNAK